MTSLRSMVLHQMKYIHVYDNVSYIKEEVEMDIVAESQRPQMT